MRISKWAANIFWWASSLDGRELWIELSSSISGNFADANFVLPTISKVTQIFECSNTCIVEQSFFPVITHLAMSTIDSGQYHALKQTVTAGTPDADFALVMDTLDLLQVCRILPGSVRGQIRVPGKCRMPVAARWGDRQHTAGRLDPKLPLMLFNEGNYLPNRRSSSACAKYAEAFLRIPLAWRSCLFPRSNAFSWARWSLVKPSRSPASRSA